MVAIDKVTAFVTRELQGQAQLLVFRHPKGDIQVPAGTVELGEKPEGAVLRELNEETGINHALILQRLATKIITLPSNRKIVTRMSKIFSEPSYDSSSAGFGVTRGTPVEILSESGSFFEILTDPIDYNQDPAERTYRIQGYLRKSLLTTTIHRHIYHLIVEEITPDSWTRFSDGISLRLTWTPLHPTTELNAIQSQWLRSVYPELLTSHLESHRLGDE
jgi:8-oxo-dGTP pyrophosphatase MutT (NUDIX family)